MGTSIEWMRGQPAILGLREDQAGPALHVPLSMEPLAVTSAHQALELLDLVVIHPALFVPRKSSSPLSSRKPVLLSQQPEPLLLSAATEHELHVNRELAVTST